MSPPSLNVLLAAQLFSCCSLPAGKGRGVVATRDVDPGELLLICSAAAVVTGPPGQQQSPRKLAAALAAANSSTAALAAVFDGSAASAATAVDLATASAAAAAAAPAGTSTARLDGTIPPTPPSIATSNASAVSSVTPTLQSLVDLNCFGEQYGDAAALSLRRERFCSYLGLWPAFALLNHACQPNASMMVLCNGSTMAVRAAAPLAAGEEVCINYIGGLVAAPLTVRQLALKQSFGFDCGCGRCAAEAAAPDHVIETLAEHYSAVIDRTKPRLLAALEAGDSAAVAKIEIGLFRRLAAMEGEIAAAVEDAGLRELLRLAAHEVHELLSLCLENGSGGSGGLGADSAPAGMPAGTRAGRAAGVTATVAGGGGGGGGGKGAVSQLALRASAARACGRGSYHAAWLSARLAERCLAQYGREHERTAQALQRCRDAHAERCGVTSPAATRCIVITQMSGHAMCLHAYDQSTTSTFIRAYVTERFLGAVQVRPRISSNANGVGGCPWEQRTRGCPS